MSNGEVLVLAIELSSDALGSIDTVVVILSDYSDTGVRWSDTFKKLFENGSILFTEKPRREKRILDTLDLPVSDHETAARCYD